MQTCKILSILVLSLNFNSDLENITLVLTAMALIFLSTTSVFHLEELYTQIREIADKAHKDSKISFKNKNF